jgi:ribosomal protein S14
MLSNKIKDLKIRKNFYAKELLKKKLKFLYLKNFNNKYFLNSRYFAVLYFFLKKKNNVFSKTKVVRRCVFTGRGRGSIRVFGVSRSVLREMLQGGVMPGWFKSIW